MKNPCPAHRSLGFEWVGQGYAKTVRHLNREPGDFVVAIADVFSFREDWHKVDQVNPLVRQYHHTLDAILRERPDLTACAVNCCHCGIRFLTDPRNAGRWNLRCPFGCRQAHRRQQSNERSRAYYQTDSGRRKKKRLNGKRSQAVAQRQQPDIASSRNLDTQGDQQAVNPDADADSDTQKSVPVERVPHGELSPPREKGTLSFGGVVLDETTPAVRKLSMSQTVERTSFDLRYQTCRLRNEATEARILASISVRGIEQPLRGVDTPQGRLLLDGFKRYRCAIKLGIECVPYVSLGDEEASGIASLMRVTENKALNIVEQARFVVELLSLHQMSIADVAEALSRSKSWVSMRRSLLDEMSKAVQEILLRGQFPVYSYMYTLRPFMRMNGVGQQEVERLVKAISGNRLSVREIELLSHGYFRGPETLRQEIDQGNWKWSLEQMQSVPEDPEACNEFERTVLVDLERLLKLMQRVASRCDNERLQSRAFHAQVNLLLGRLLSRRESFFTKMEALLRRTGETS